MNENLNQTSYSLLPFQFERRLNGQILLVNDVGEYHFLSDLDFQSFIDRSLPAQGDQFNNLKSKHFLYNGNLAKIIDLLAVKYRTKKRFLYEFTSLHMFVLSRRCNQHCSYCHASSINEASPKSFDMDSATARKAVDIAFGSPSKAIKIEFQGGEPLLNFNVLKEIVEYAKELNQSAQKILEFVLCTNTVGLTHEHLDFIKAHNIYISTSLDGPRDIHDACRKLRNGQGSYDLVSEHIPWIQSELGKDKISALTTITPFNLYRLKEVIDEYIKQGFDSIFLRMLNPFGRAHLDRSNLRYSVDEFIQNYRAALEYIIDINLKGKFFSEYFATLLLSRILTPFSTGFVDLQSPTGTGISAAIYDYDGNVYVSDEARMLAAMTGDKTFFLGNLHQNSWEEMFYGSKLKKIISDSCLESLPGCAWCVYQPYCGSDPVRNYFTFNDLIGKRPESDFCRKHKALFYLIFEQIENGSEDVQDVLWSWITGKNKLRENNFPQNEDETISRSSQSSF
jgi:uncharacterized protein